MSEWEWHGETAPNSIERQAWEGWEHTHPDGSRWVHPERECQWTEPVAVTYDSREAPDHPWPHPYKCVVGDCPGYIRRPRTEAGRDLLRLAESNGWPIDDMILAVEREILDSATTRRVE